MIKARNYTSATAFRRALEDRLKTISRTEKIDLQRLRKNVALKIHAYSLPRPRPNTRVRDLLDMFLLIRTGNLRNDKTREAIRKVFAYRRTHLVPITLSPPPLTWKNPFENLALEC